MPSKKKKYSARFPPARIKKIMQTDEEVGKVNAAVPVIISRALEMFIEGLIIKSGETTKIRNAKTLSTAHIKHTILSEKKFDFLKDLVANIPDVQGDEDAETGIPMSVAKPRTPHEPNQPRKVGRPRKQIEPNENVVKRRPGRPRKERNTSSTSSGSMAGENSDLDDEETETDEEERPPEFCNGPENENLSQKLQASHSVQQPSTSTAVPYTFHHPPISQLPGAGLPLPPMMPIASTTEDDDYDS